MQEFVLWPEVIDWQQFSGVFLTMSIIALLFSVALNYNIKDFPVLAAQLSMLLTLAVFPLVNRYLIIAGNEDVLARIDYIVSPATFGPLIFFAPLPVCVIVTIIFVIYNTNKAQKKSASLFSKITPILNAFGCIVSLVIGSVWLSINMLFSKEGFTVNLWMFFCYTILGFGMYVFSGVILLAIKTIISKMDK